MKRRISDASLYCLHAAVQPYDSSSCVQAVTLLCMRRLKAVL